MYRFAFRPLWLLSHLFSIFLVVLFVNLGFWQLRRLDEKEQRRDTITARREESAVALPQLLAETKPADIETLRYRRATVEGTYVRGADIQIDNRSKDGLPGAWIVTPMRLDDGSIVAVSRGFQGFDSGRIDPPPPPSGTVEVVGTIMPWDTRNCGIRRDDAGTPAGAACLRRDAVEGALGSSVAPVVLQRVSSTPPDADEIFPVPPPEIGLGPHKSYAVQWFIFATIGVIGYPIILRRVAQDKAREASGAPDEGSARSSDDTAEQADGPGDDTDDEPTDEPAPSAT